MDDWSDASGPMAIVPSELEYRTRSELARLFAERPIPDDSILDHLEVYMRPQRISEIVTLSELYRQVLAVPGSVLEFGVRWGRHLSVFTALRTMLEPTNFTRRIVGFDTFSGFQNVESIDGESTRVTEGAMSVTPGYRAHLESVLALHEAEGPMSHLCRFELCEGDAPVELAAYLERHPETIVALAYFDMDLYRPTRDCLDLLLPRMPRGAILAFDELLHPEFPGETVALLEALDLRGLDLRRFPTSPYPSYVIL